MLFGGFGFQNAEAQLTPLMTETFRNERAVKSFRELADPEEGVRWQKVPAMTLRKDRDK